MATKKKDISRFQTSGLNDAFNFENATFSEYVVGMREIIEKARLDINDDNAEKFIDANSPYEWIPEAPEAINPETGRFHCGILFIHGLFDSPLVFDCLAKSFMQKNYLLRAILLPGHGTVPGDLLNVRHEEWSKATQFGINSFKNQVDKFYIAGFSTGGLLALIHAYQDYPIDGLLLFAPAIKLKPYFSIISSFNNSIVQSIISWYIKAEDKDYAKYQSITVEAGKQVYLLTRELQKYASASSLETPLFIVCAADDEVIPDKAILNYFSSQTNSQSKLIYYTNNVLETDDPRILQFPANDLEQNIISFSHVCLPICPNHPHYGIHGDFIDYHHYKRLFGLTLTPTANSETKYGAANRENFKKYNFKRLTYNPDFNRMKTLMLEFIANNKNKRKKDLYSLPVFL